VDYIKWGWCFNYFQGFCRNFIEVVVLKGGNNSTRRVDKLKKTLLCLMTILIICSILITGCGGAEEPAEAVEKDPVISEEPIAEEPIAEEFKVGLMMDGPFNDAGWNAGAYEGLMKIEEDLGATVSYSESVAQSDVEETFRAYGSQGYDLVIAHGFNFIDGAFLVAADYPDTVFVLTGCEVQSGDNLGSVTDDAIMKGFLGGVVAATITESDTVAFVGGMPIPAIIDGGKGFIAGAKYVNPDIVATVVNIGNFTDAAKGKELAYSLIDKGADVIQVEADMAGFGVMEAAEEKGIYIIGSSSDQYTLAPDVIVTSTVADFPHMLSLTAEQVMDGTYEVGSVQMGLKENVVFLAPFREFEEEIGAEAIAEIEAIVQKLLDGEIDTRALVEQVADM
jgi:basic membrane protein A